MLCHNATLRACVCVRLPCQFSLSSDKHRTPPSDTITLHNAVSAIHNQVVQHRQQYMGVQVKPEPQDPTATMDTAPYPPSPQGASVVKAEPPISASGDPSTDPANLTPPPGAQQMEVAVREGGAEGARTAAVGVKAEPSQDSLMQEASLQVGNTDCTTCSDNMF